MISILISAVLLAQDNPVESFKVVFMPYPNAKSPLVKHMMAERGRFYRDVTSGKVVIPESEESVIRGMIRRDLQETETIIKAKETPRNLRSLARVHFRDAVDALAKVEKRESPPEQKKTQ